jgi:hypothetical protein
MERVRTQCKDCRWWNPLAERRSGVRVGECRRYPPSVLPTGLVYHTFCERSDLGFPLSSEDGWCGEAHY